MKSIVNIILSIWFCQVLKLSNFYDIQEIRQFPEEYGITRELERLKNEIKVPTVQILDDQAKKNIGILRDSRLNDFVAYKFVENVILLVLMCRFSNCWW